MAMLFDLLIQACGLSQRRAADILKVRIDTIKSWASGRRQAPQEVLADLSALVVRIETEAAQLLAQIDDLADQHGEHAEIELGIASDDAEARSIGWPCVGAQRASLALVVARGMERGYRFRLVPRGSTVATAAAADAHGT
jgi:hypothetical protein